MSRYSLPGTARLKTVGALWRYHSQNVTNHAAHDYCNAYLKTVRDLGAFGIETLRDKAVLDLGCGQRYPFSLLAAGAGARVVGLDVTSIEPRLSVAGIVRTSRRNGLLRAAKSAVRSVVFDRRYYSELERLSGVSRKAADGVSFVWSDPAVGSYPLQSEQFDLVVSIAVLEHVRDVPLVAKEIARVLKPGGLLYAFVHNYYSLSGGHRLEWAYPDREAPTDIEPWDHLRSRRWPPDYYLNRLRSDEYRGYLEAGLTVLQLEGRDEAHDAGGYEGERYLVGAAAEELRSYPRDLLLTRSWCIVARKPVTA
jgi:SAM-dependent methyltransferase